MVTSRVGALFAFTKKKETCLGCKSVLKESEAKNPLCSHCKVNATKLYMNHLNKYRTLESQFSRLWTECQRCQGSLHEEVICTRYLMNLLLFSLRHTVQYKVTLLVSLQSRLPYILHEEKSSVGSSNAR